MVIGYGCSNLQDDNSFITIVGGSMRLVKNDMQNILFKLAIFLK